MKRQLQPTIEENPIQGLNGEQPVGCIVVGLSEEQIKCLQDTCWRVLRGIGEGCKAFPSLLTFVKLK